jgi:tRNA(Arg) A34 adenosine deaminase TadA
MSGTTGRTQGQEDAYFMDLVLKLAELALTRGQTPFGAVVVDGHGRLIGEGHNTVRADFDPTAHGEIVAVRDAWRRLGAWEMLKGSTLYTSCEPCLLCSFVITQIAFRRVVFAARGTDIPAYRPLLEADLTVAAAWVNAQPGCAPLEVVGNFMRERALRTIAAFLWTQAQARTCVNPPTSQ